MTSSPETRKHIDSAKQHSRETRLQIWLPMALGILLIGLLAGIMMLFPPTNRAGIALVADWMLTIMVLLPAVICLFVVAVLMMVLAISITKIHAAVARPLNRLENLSEQMLTKTAQVTEKVNTTTESASARLAMFDKVLGVFDLPEDDGDQKKEDERNKPS